MKIFMKVIAFVLILALVMPMTFAGKPSFVIDKQEEKDNGNWSRSWNFKTKYDAYDEEIKVLKLQIEGLEYLLGMIDEVSDDVDLTEFASLTDAEKTAKLEELKLELKDLQALVKLVSTDLKTVRKELRNLIRKGYTNDELAEYEALKLRLQERYSDIFVLDIDSIIAENTRFKFDTPPVIKGGRTLIPVSALVKGFGAEVEWDPVLRKVTITKDDITIVIYIDSNITYVNGKKVVLDTEAIILENRTVVPLRFIAEVLGLKVNWNPDDLTIEIEDYDTTLTSSDDSVVVKDSLLLLTEDVSRADFVSYLSAPGAAVFVLLDQNNQALTIDDALVTVTDKVVVTAENGYTTETYVIRKMTSDVSLTTTDDAVTLDGETLVVPEGVDRDTLQGYLEVSAFSTLNLVDLNNIVLDEDTSLVLETDKVKVTAEDGTIKYYPIRYFDDTYTIESTYTIKDMMIVVEETTTRLDLINSITVDENSTFELRDSEGNALDNNDVDDVDDLNLVLDLSEVIVVISEDGVEHPYTLRYIHTDATITSTLPLNEQVITVDELTTREALMSSITKDIYATIVLKNELGDELVIDESIVALTDIVLVTAEDGTTKEYTLTLPPPPTSLETTYSIDGTVISVMNETVRSEFLDTLIFTEGETFELQDLNDVAFDTEGLAGFITLEDKLVVETTDGRTITYTFYILDNQSTIVTTYPMNGTVITIDETTRLEMFDSITKPASATLDFVDSTDVALEPIDGTLLLDTDKIIVTAEDGTTTTYTFVYDQSSVDLIITNPTFTLNVLELTVLDGTNIALLKSGVSVDQGGSFVIMLADTEQTEDATILTADMTIVVTSGDGLNTETYTIAIGTTE